MRAKFSLTAALSALLLMIAVNAQAQLTWSSYNTSGVRVNANAGAYNNAVNSYTFTVPAGTTYTFITTNFAPVTLSPSTIRTVTFALNASGGFGTTATPIINQRFVAYGLFNYGATPPDANGSFTDDLGLWTDTYQQATGLKPEVFGGVSTTTNLLGYSNAKQLGAGTAGGAGVLTDGATFNVTFRTVENASGSASIGTGASNDVAGAVYTDAAGTTTLRTVYSSAVAAATLSGAITFNEFGFLFINTTASPVTLVLSNITGLTPPPIITSQPTGSATASVGSDYTFSVAATGATTYQWQKSTDGGATFAPIAGNATAATASLTLTNVQTSDAAVYNVVLTNAAGSTVSAGSTLMVSAGAIAPSVQTPPASSSVVVGASPTFSVVANGTSPLTYQWQKGGVNLANGATGSGSTISGATSATLTIVSAQLSDAGSYQVVVTNSAGSATGGPATLTVNQGPSFTTQPVGATLNPGSSYTLTAAASGTPAPTYQWHKNGAAISGANGSSLTLSNVTGANTGNYTVVATNSVGSVTSAVASIAVLSQSLVSTAFTTSPAAGLNPDARLSISFNQTVSYGVSGLIRIYDASTNGVVDTIDMVAATNLMNTLRATSATSTLAAPVQNKSVGGLSNFNYYPVIISGSTATLYPRNNALTYGKTYYVAIDAGAFVDSTGAAYPGIAASGNSSAWTFSTKAAGPSASATTLTVAADGAGDFDTVQGALDFVPAGNTTARTISIRKGTYFEEVYFTGKHSLTLLGEDRAQTIVAYPNNNNFNNVSGTYHRATLMADHCNNFTLTNLSVKNTTPKGGSQAEALLLNGVNTSQAIVTNASFYSYQDTVQFNGQTYISNSYIEGDVDFMWGNGPNFYSNCQLKMLTTGGFFTQIRNSSSNHGNAYLNCTLTAASGVTGFLARIDPTAFPYSEVVWINCTMGSFLNTTTGASGSSYNYGWYQLNNATAATATTNIHDWDYNTKDANGNPLTFTPKPAFATMPTDAATISNYSMPSYVLGNNWTPSLAPIITSQPLSQHVNGGQSATFSVGVSAIPDATYQWRKNGTVIAGATGVSYTIASASWADAGNYSVTVTNTLGSVTSSAASLALDNDPGTNYVSGYGLDPATNGAPDADPDNDGISNKFEFFLGGIPTNSSVGILPVSATVNDASGNPQALAFEFNRSRKALGTPYTVEYTADLTSGWTAATDSVNGISISITAVDSNTDHVKVTIPAAGTKLFARLHL